jgi:hypothetical protein
MLEEHAFFRHAVDVRRLDARVAVAGQLVGSQGIRRHQHDIEWSSAQPTADVVPERPSPERQGADPDNGGNK